MGRGFHSCMASVATLNHQRVPQQILMVYHRSSSLHIPTYPYHIPVGCPNFQDPTVSWQSGHRESLEPVSLGSPCSSFSAPTSSLSHLVIFWQIHSILPYAKIALSQFYPLVKTCQNMSKHVKTCQNMSKHVKTCQNPSNVVKTIINYPAEFSPSTYLLLIHRFAIAKHQF